MYGFKTSEMDLKLILFYSGFRNLEIRFFFFSQRRRPIFWRRREKSSSSMKDSDPPPPYCSGQREVSAFGANPLEEAEELDLFSRFCTVQGWD